VVLLFLIISAAPSSELADAIRAYEQLDYRGARVTLLRVIDEPDLSGGNRIEALAYLGRIHAVLDEPVRAQRRFEAVLALDPDYSVAWEESPKIRELFVRAQKERARKQAIAAKRREAEAKAKLRVDPTPKSVVRVPPSLPPPPERGPTSPPTEDDMTWRIVGGVGLTVALGIVVTILAVGSGGGEEEPEVIPTATWRLP
jgi:hypothetical protein